MDRTTWDRRYAGSELVWTAAANRSLVTEVGALAPARALDLACGEGRNAIWLAERGWQVTGVDFSTVGLHKAKQLADARGVSAEWVAADLNDYQPDPQAFELVIVLYLQVPAAERTLILRNAAVAVAADGVFLLIGHDRANIADGHGGPRDPNVLYTAQEIAEDLAGTGLVLERAERVERPVEAEAGPRLALDALVRAHRA